MRDKWDSTRGESSYGAQTIERALEGRTEFWAAPEVKHPEPPKTAHLAKRGENTSRPEGLLTGAEFILDTPREVPAVWGEDSQVLWASGEPLYLVGPAGVGKTTLAQNLLLRRRGIG